MDRVPSSPLEGKLRSFVALSRDEVFEGSLGNCCRWAAQKTEVTGGEVVVYKVRGGEREANSALKIDRSGIYSFEGFICKTSQLRRGLKRGHESLAEPKA